MRSVLAIAHNEWQHVWRDKVAMLFLLVMPLVFTVGVSALTGGSSGTPLSVGLSGDRQGHAAQAVLTWAATEPKFHLIPVELDQVSEMTKQGRLDAVLTIEESRAGGPARYSVLADRSTDRGSRAWGTISSILAEADGEQTAASLIPDRQRSLVAQAMENYRSELKKGAVTVDDGNSDAPMGAQHASPAMAVMYLLMFAAIAGEGIVYERLGGTMTRIRVAPVSMWQYLLGRLGGKVSLAVLQFLMLVVFGRYVMGVYWGPSVADLTVLVVLFSVTCGCFGLFLGSLCRTPEQNTAIATTASLALAALGGCWWPLDVVPEWMRRIGLVLPTGQAMHGLELLQSAGLDAKELMTVVTWLTAYSLVFLAGAVWGQGIRRGRSRLAPT